MDKVAAAELQLENKVATTHLLLRLHGELKYNILAGQTAVYGRE